MKRIAWILSVGCFALLGLVATSRLLSWHSRYVSDDELRAKEKATRDREEKNDVNFAMRRGPVWRLSALDERYRRAAEVVTAELIRQKEEPSKFRVKVYEEEAGKTLIFELVHVDDWLPKNRGTYGNPSGKDRKMKYDVRTAKVTYTGMYQ